MGEKKKICLVIPSLNAGGMERVMSELAGNFAANSRLEVHLILYGLKPELFYSVPSNLIIHKPTFIFNNKYRFWFTLKTLVFLRKKIKKISPHSILSFGEYWNSFVLIALYGLKYPIYVSDRCQPDKSLGKLHNFLRKKLYPKANGLIVQTAKARVIYNQILPITKLCVIGNPVREIKPNSTIHKENIVLSVGRLIKSKHHDHLIRIFSKINLPGWKLIIVGGDAIRQENMKNLQELIRESGAINKVELTGTRNDIDQYYLKSKIFAFTSSSEGFPNVVGEALTSGIPVVSYDCVAGPSEMITDNENGFLVPVFDDELFMIRLQTLMEDDTLRVGMGKKAFESMKKFSVDAIAQQYLNFILSTHSHHS